MKTIRTYHQQISILFISLFLFSCTSNGYSLPNPPQLTSEGISKSNEIKIALLLDTSSSMQGLLEQAKSQLWKIVNVLSMAKKNQENAMLKISLYQYGNNLLNSREGYIEQILPLTNDLDAISEKLFALTTNGGEEYCGHVIQTATNQLDWNAESTGLNLIFIAGNEPFNQGNVNYNNSCLKAKEKQITVNTIFCGDNLNGINSFWKAGAIATGGNYMSIHMNQKTIYVSTPYDEKISALNDSLNTTYLSYGKQGRLKKQNQTTQDNNSSSFGLENRVSRAVSKSSHNYYNAHWDLIDASKDKKFEISKIETSTLPVAMHKMDDNQKLVYIKKVSKKRERINTQIRNLNKQRISYISSHKGNGAESSLDYVMLNAIKNQAIKKGFVFDDSTANPMIEKAYVDFDYFEKITKKAKTQRTSRLINFNTFVKYSKEPKTIILDTRSKRMYDRLHLKGAVHINFSDFTQQYLTSIIPDTNTRILIYCNNNFKQTTEIPQLQNIQSSIRRNMASKAFIPINLKINLNTRAPINTMALNIPTYINLYGYHFRNVYELSELVSVNNPLLEFEGSEVNPLKK
jgi:hypothetical protein